MSGKVIIGELACCAVFVGMMIGVGYMLDSSTSHQACFEEPGDHDIKLACYSKDYLDSMVALLKQRCGIYSDGRDDCANWFTDSKSYGGTTFNAGSVCTVTWHSVAFLSACVDQVLSESAGEHRYFGITDGFITAAIAISGLCGLACIGACIWSCFSKQNPQDQAEMTINNSDPKTALLLKDQLVQPSAGGTFDKLVSGDPENV